MELSKGEYWILVEQSPILIWRANETSECDYFNERWLAFRGRTMEQEVGNGWTEGVHPDDFRRCVDIYLTSFHARRVFEMEYRLLRYDGQYRWIFDRGVPFFTQEGGFAGYIGSCVDVTERVEAQEALNSAKDRQLRSLQELLPLCSQCKKIKRDDGAWQPLDEYVRARSDTEFSHGMCPDCLREFTILHGLNRAL